MPDAARLSALTHWLIAGAPGPERFADLVGEIGRRVEACGLPIGQFGIYMTMVNPEIPGRHEYWSPAGGTRVRTLSLDELTEGDRWIGLPAQECQVSGRMVVYTPRTDPNFDERPDMQALHRRGYTQMIFLPLHSRYTPAVNIAAFLTKQAGGFTPDQVDALRRLQAPIARVTEGFVLHESTIEVLSTYVGRDAGDRVLTGNIRRGHTEVIPAIVVFVDLKGFTALSNTVAPAEAINLLNRFFGALDMAIRRHGGEILKFVGDGALCIFPTPDDHAAQIAAASSALSALDDVRTALACHEDAAGLAFRAALNLGDVHYGNIGSGHRLDFTVIGATVNLAARLIAAASELGEDTVCSGSIARLVDAPVRRLGERTFKGFAEPIEIYAL